jgi:predicted nucleotidyltransferase
MPNLVDVVAALADLFGRLQIRYAIGGALANNYWGVVRATQDIDCLVSLPAIKYQQFADELNGIGCVQLDATGNSVPVDVPRLLEQVQKHKVIECFLQSVRIELFVPAVPLQDEILRRAVPVRLSEREIPVTTAEDLILLKLAFHRIKALQDIRGILWVQRGRLDLNYLRTWSKRTHAPGVQQELESLIAQYSIGKADNLQS